MRLYYVIRKGAKITDYEHLSVYSKKEDAEDILKWANLHMREHELRYFDVDKNGEEDTEKAGDWDGYINYLHE